MEIYEPYLEYDYIKQQSQINKNYSLNNRQSDAEKKFDFDTDDSDGKEDRSSIYEKEMKSFARINRTKIGNVVEPKQTLMSNSAYYNQLMKE